MSFHDNSCTEGFVSIIISFHKNTCLWTIYVFIYTNKIFPKIVCMWLPKFWNGSAFLERDLNIYGGVNEYPLYRSIFE